MGYQLTIKSAEDFHHPDPSLGKTSAAERIVLNPLLSPFAKKGLPTTISNRATAYVRVDWGRWIVDCPWCRSAQAASKEDHRFFCVECGNHPVDGAWVNVVWPNEWKEIEGILSRRPSKDHQWWSPGETLDKLEAENKEHGVR